MEENRFIVYKHTNKINGKVYIGQTCRKYLSMRYGKNGEGYINSPYFYNAIQKYGWDNFEHEIIHTDLTQEEADIKEKELIKLYRSDEKEYGYNLQSGGHTNNMTEEIKNNISRSNLNRLQNNRNQTGESFSEQHREKLRQKSLQQEHKKITEEQRKKISSSVQHTRNSIFGMYDDNNNLIKVFLTIKDILSFLNLRDDGELRKARKTGKKYHGYYWQDLPKADIDKYKKYIN